MTTINAPEASAASASSASANASSASDASDAPTSSASANPPANAPAAASPAPNPAPGALQAATVAEHRASLAARAELVAQAGYFDATNEEVVPSPCISVCRMTADRSHCEGCYRTLDELRAWSTAPSAQRCAVWRQLLQRADLAVPAPLLAGG